MVPSGDKKFFLDVSSVARFVGALADSLSSVSLLRRIASSLPFVAASAFSYLSHLNMYLTFSLLALAFVLILAGPVIRFTQKPRPSPCATHMGSLEGVRLHKGVLARASGGRTMVSVQAKISNTPRSGRTACAIKAATCAIVVADSGERYSPLPWLGERGISTVIEPGETKDLVLAVADYENVGVSPYRHLWSFVTVDKGAGSFRHAGAGDIPNGARLRLEIADGGRLMGHLDLVWKWKDNIFAPAVTLAE